MKKPVLLLVSMLFIIAASAQKVFFLYVQSEDQSPFYIKMSGKLHSSASSGFLVISNLSDSTYPLTVGYSYKTAPEQNYKVTISGSDKGLLLKSSEGGLSVVDINNNIALQPEQEVKQEVAYETKTDRFSQILSKAADDPSLTKVIIQPKREEPLKKEEPIAVVAQIEEVQTDIKKEESTKEVAVAVKEEPKSTLVVPVESLPKKVEEKADIVSVKNEEKKEDIKPIEKDSITKTAKDILTGESEKSSVAKTEVIEIKSSDEIKIEAPAEKNEEYKRSKVKRASKSSTSEGSVMVYYDATKGSTDTIRIIIPNQKVAIKQPESVVPQPEAQTTEVKEVIIVTEEKVKDPIIQKTTSLNTSCSSFASDKDFLKLRKNMAGKVTDELMVDEAKKYFKKQCFSSEHLRNLSALFLTSAGKYQFFDAAYLYVADKENFASLHSEIKDEYYLKRFKALVGE